MNLCGYIPESISEGPGLRAVIFVSGCLHACPGCFNPESWSFEAGEPLTEARLQEILQEMSSNPLLAGLTLCGGDPFFSVEECAGLVSRFRAACPGKTVWAYTGFTFEALMRHPARRKLALLCDVIIDGRFIEAEKDVSLPYRGSRNQRLVDVKSSASRGQTVLLQS